MGTSKWVLLNLETRRLARVPKSTAALLEASSEGSRFALWDGANNEKVPALPFGGPLSRLSGPR